MKKIIFTILILILVVTIPSCKKGDTGPAGSNGKDGNANVVSGVITSSNWVFNSPSYQITFSYPAITQDIIDKGAVLVYIKVGSSYNQLPLTFYPSSTYSRTYQVSTSVGYVSIFSTDSDLVSTNPGSQTFKIVVISSSALIKNPNLNLENYQDVKQTFNLKD